MNLKDVELTLAVPRAPENPNDPHRGGQVVSGALYELLAVLYKHGMSDGVARTVALARAGDAIGKLLLRSLTFVGEQRVSLRDWACALVRAQELRFRGEWRHEVLAALQSRALVHGPDDLR